MNEIIPSFEMISSRIEHEDNLLNQRVSWIVSSQAFLLTGYAILLNAPLQPRSELFQHDHAMLVKLIPFTSIFITLLLWFGILAGIWAIRDLRARAKAHPAFEARQTLARPLTRAIGLATPALVPVVFLITWLWLLFR
jgi:hypothetical protein